ncbi:MAG TPA: uroporphyrinogen-III synthase [Candidatus Sulfotelmatobacter sp.]|nr:uroporphyrinogen-III synthase [Candidatus Sulfotelmatobacter sp.]
MSKGKAEMKVRGPLSGVRVLVGRARHQAGALATELRDIGADVIEIPFIEIRTPRSYKALDSALKELAEYDWLILTSVNGVEALFSRWDRLHKGEKSLSNVSTEGLRVAAIGPATKKAIEQRGMQVDVVPKEYVAESVVSSLSAEVAGKRVLLVRAKIARDVIPTELRKAGARVDVIEAYETVVPAASRARLQALMKNPKRRPHVVTFTSSSTVKNFLALLGPNERGLSKARLDGILTSSIGPVTSATLKESGLKVDIEAKEFTIPGLVAALRLAFESRPLAGGIA